MSHTGGEGCRELFVEIEQLQAMLAARGRAADEIIKELRAEVERLQVELVEKDKLYLREMAKTVARLAEIERLTAALEAVADAYSMIDNPEPISLIMRRIARRALEGK